MLASLQTHMPEMVDSHTTTRTNVFCAACAPCPACTCPPEAPQVISIWGPVAVTVIASMLSGWIGQRIFDAMMGYYRRLHSYLMAYLFGDENAPTTGKLELPPVIHLTRRIMLRS